MPLLIDKIRLAGLIATLIHYIREEATAKIPVWRMIAMPLDEINRRAQEWAGATAGLGKVADGESMIGGGSLPGSTLPTKVVIIGRAGKKASSWILKVSQMLRQWQTPIVGRVQENALILDPRSVLPEEDGIVIDALKSICQKI